MALTRITKGVIKPNENYDTHNINSTGIVTAIGLDVNGNGDISGNLSVGGVLTYEDVTSIDSVGIITAQKDIHVGAGVSAVGVGTFGSLDISGDIDVDGHTNLDNVSIAGVTTNTGILYANSSVRINTTDDQALRLNATDNGPIYMRFDRSGARKAWLGYGSATDSLSLRNEISDGDLYLSVTDGGSTKSAIHIDSSENAKVNIPQDLDVDGHTELDNVNIAGVTTFSDNDIHFKNNGITSCRFDSNQGSFHFNHSGGLFWYKNGNLSSSSGATIFYSEFSHQYKGLVIQAPWQGQNNAKNVTVQGSSNGRFLIQNNLNASETFSSYFQGGTHLGYYQSGTKLSTTSTGVSLPQDLDVDGHTNLDNVSIAGFTTFAQNINVTGSMTGQSVVLNAGSPTIFLNDTDADSDFSIQCNGGLLKFMDTTNSYATRLSINSSGNVSIAKDLDVDGHTNLDNVSVAGVTTMTSSVTPILRLEKSSSDGSVLYAIRQGNTSGGGAELRVTDGYSATVPLYAFWYNNNTGIGNPAANTTSFIQNGSEKVRITSTGQVLLGATSGGNPDTDDLIVSGSGKKGITVCSTNGSECRLTFADGLSGVNAVAGNITYTHSIDSLDLYTATTRRLRIDSSGRLLLGTTTEGYSSADDLTVSTSGTTGITIRSGTSNTGTLAFSDGTSGADEYRGYIQYEHQNDALAFGSNGTERLRITSTGNIQHTSASGVSYFTGSSEYIIGSQYSSPSAGGPEAKFQVHENKSRATVSINGYYNNAGSPILQFVSSRSNTKGVLGTKAVNGDYIGDIRFFGDNGTNGSTLVQSAAIHTRQRSNISDGDTVAAGEISFLTGTATGGSVTEKLKIGSSGQVDIGTSGVLKAVINNSVSGHQFISQCDDNNDGFEIYQQHGSTSSRNTLAVYNNSTGSKHLNFYVRGDNQVHISTNKDSVGLVMDGTSSGTAYGETGATIDFRQLNEVNQFTGNPAARIASYLERGNNGFGLKFYGRNSASSFAAMVQLSADYEWEPCSDQLCDLGSPDRSWDQAYIANAYPDQGTEYRITSGSYSNGQWHDTAFRRNSMGGLNTNGVYIVTAYADLYQAMGGNYGCNYTWIVGVRDQYTNQTLVNTCPLLSVTGHSTNNFGASGATVGDGIRLGTRREPSSSGGQEYIVWRPAASTGTIDNTAGRTLVFRVQRIGRSSLG